MPVLSEQAAAAARKARPEKSRIRMAETPGGQSQTATRFAGLTALDDTSEGRRRSQARSPLAVAVRPVDPGLALLVWGPYPTADPTRARMRTPTDRLTTALAGRYRIERHLGE